jgi:hypothetical protein
MVLRSRTDLFSGVNFSSAYLSTRECVIGMEDAVFCA